MSWSFLVWPRKQCWPSDSERMEGGQANHRARLWQYRNSANRAQAFLWHQFFPICDIEREPNNSAHKRTERNDPDLDQGTDSRTICDWILPTNARLRVWVPFHKLDWSWIWRRWPIPRKLLQDAFQERSYLGHEEMWRHSRIFDGLLCEHDRRTQ